MSTQADRLSAALSGRYRIERELGAGGMATVYLAADLKHDRKVAIKVLKPELAAVLGAERFVVEIKTTAAMSHPHILPLFDSGTVEGFLFYVMPYIQGETIREKLNRETQFGIEEAIRITTEIADALDYAHRHGVIHRDIKPENILLHDGRPMVMDFGIALAVSAAAGGRMTETGLSLGTPHYMSPEQATAEKEITGRSDVYSLASVCYEMLAGQPPHLGGSAQQIIMKIIAEPVPVVTQYRKTVPPNVASALARALEKLPADRFESAAKFADALRDADYGAAAARAQRAVAAAGSRWNRLTVAFASLAAGLALVAGWAIVTRPAVRPPQVTRSTLELPEQVQLGSGSVGSRVAISRDGSHTVFVGWRVGAGTLRRQLFSRKRDRLEAVPIPGTEAGNSPFFSPDGERIGFIAGDPPAIKWVPIEGGAPVVAADSSLDLNTGLTVLGGAVWGLEGAIYTRSLRGVIRVPEFGGASTLVSRIDTAGGERAHSPTDVLPNGRGLLFTVGRHPVTLVSLHDIAVVDLESGRHRILVRGVYGRYVAPGYLVFLRADGAFAAAPFDQDRMELTGPVVTLGGIDADARVRDFAVADDGTLLHVDQAAPADSSEIVWVTRDGTTTAFDPSWHAAFETVSISPDGRQLATGVLTRGGADVWIAQLPAGPHAKLTTEGAINYRPTWLPDAQRVAWRSINTSTGRFELVAKRADGLGPTERLAGADRSISTGFVSRDGQWRVYRTDATERGRGDIYALRTGDSIPTPLVATEAEERFPTLSADGRWLAYRSNEGGTHDIWVRPFPNVSDGRWQVSVAGGTEPVWSHSGKELFYLTPDNELVAATVTTRPTFSVLERKVLFTRPAAMAMNIASTTYDVSADDSRFLTIRTVNAKRPGEKVDDNSGGRLVLVQNWVEELKARVPR